LFCLRASSNSGVPCRHKPSLAFVSSGHVNSWMAQGTTNFDLAATATNQLAVDLHRQLAKGHENVRVSPYSIESALAMTFAGADGETRTEMARVLHFPTDDNVPASFSTLQRSLEDMRVKTAERAHGRIRDLIPARALNKMTRLVLANALYLKAPWADPFSEKSTQRELFHVRGGAPVDVPMMRKTAEFGYVKREGFTAVSLPYVGDDLQ